MILSHKAYGVEVIIKTDSEDVGIEDMMEQVKCLLYAIGYPPKLVDEYFEDNGGENEDT